MARTGQEIWTDLETSEELRAITAAMPVYDRDVRCPKCDFRALTTRHRPMDVGNPRSFGFRFPVAEAMVRCCPQCGFDFCQRPLDRS